MYDKKTDQYASGKLLGFSITVTKIVWWLGSARTRWEKGEETRKRVGKEERKAKEGKYREKT